MTPALSNTFSMSMGSKNPIESTQGFNTQPMSSRALNDSAPLEMFRNSQPTVKMLEQLGMRPSIIN